MTGKTEYRFCVDVRPEIYEARLATPAEVEAYASALIDALGASEVRVYSEPAGWVSPILLIHINACGVAQVDHACPR